MRLPKHLPYWLPEWIRKAWHRRRCTCCVYECEWDWVNCWYCLNGDDVLTHFQTPEGKD